MGPTDGFSLAETWDLAPVWRIRPPRPIYCVWYPQDYNIVRAVFSDGSTIDFYPRQPAYKRMKRLALKGA